MVLSPGDDVSELDDTGAGTNEAVFSDAESNEAGTADFPGGDDHLTNSQGFLVPTAASAVLPECPPVVMPSSQEDVLLDDLAMSDDGDVNDEDEEVEVS